MTDLERKDLLFLLVKSRLEDEKNLQSDTFARMSSQIHFAKMCEIITQSEYEELDSKITLARFGKEK